MERFQVNQRILHKMLQLSGLRLLHKQIETNVTSEQGQDTGHRYISRDDIGDYYVYHYRKTDPQTGKVHDVAVKHKKGNSDPKQATLHPTGDVNAPGITWEQAQEFPLSNPHSFFNHYAKNKAHIDASEKYQDDYRADASEERPSDLPVVAGRDVSTEQVLETISKITGKRYFDFDDFARKSGGFLKDMEAIVMNNYKALYDDREAFHRTNDRSLTLVWESMRRFAEKVQKNENTSDWDRSMFGPVGKWGEIPKHATEESLKQWMAQNIKGSIKNEYISGLPAGKRKGGIHGKIGAEERRRILDEHRKNLGVKQVIGGDEPIGEEGGRPVFEQIPGDFEDPGNRPGEKDEATLREEVDDVLDKFVKQRRILWPGRGTINGRTDWEIVRDAMREKPEYPEEDPRRPDYNVFQDMIAGAAKKHFRQDTGLDISAFGTKSKEYKDYDKKYYQPYMNRILGRNPDLQKKNWAKYINAIREELAPKRVGKDVFKSLALLRLSQANLMLNSMMGMPSLNKSDDFQPEKWYSAVQDTRKRFFDENHPMFWETVQKKYKQLAWHPGYQMPFDATHLVKFNPNIYVPNPLLNQSEEQGGPTCNKKLSCNIDMEPL